MTDMATAETRRKEDESRSQDASPGQAPSRARRSTRQLDFFQAMSDFKQMFPTLDDEVIEAVLRANDGAVDATIDQLLTMTIDEGVSECDLPMGGTDFAVAEMPKYEDHHDTSLLAMATVQSTDSPPSYSEAIRNPGSQDAPTNIWTTPIRPLPLTGSGNRSQLNLEVEANPEPVGALGGMARLSPSSLPSRRSSSGLRYSPTLESPSFGVRRSSATDLTGRKKEFRNWNPPMLGNLPDDFLRIMSPENPNCANSDFERLSNLPTTPVNVMSLSDARPKIHKSRSKSEKVSRSFNLGTKDGNERDTKSKSSEKKGKSSDKVTRSFSLVDDSSRSKGSKGARHKSRHLSPNHHSVIIETHDFSKDMLEERIKENERRRKRTSAGFDPELAQYLEDEQLALALQNSEFLQDLRGNEDFMQTLQRETSNSGNVSSPVVPAPTITSTPIRPPEDVHEGYGDDSDKTLDAFPFSQNTGKDKDEDAELRQQLRSMGKASKKQFASLAKKFFRRKKKNSKQILGQKLTPSTLNLLEDDDDDDDVENDINTNGRYGNSPTEIEPLPTTLTGVPSHRTVQRPAYRPEGVTTYFDNANVDMV